MTIFWTNTPAFCRQLTGNPPRLDSDEPLPEEEPEDAWRGTMGTGVDWTGRTPDAGLSSVRGGGRLSRKLVSLVCDLCCSVPYENILKNERYLFLLSS